MTHDELQNDLASHLSANTGRMVWTNTQLGPSGSPRPDVFTVDKSFARFRADCYEIKVSVSDLRSDLTKGKWQSYRKFGHAVWFAFPRGLAPLDLIPPECGVMLRGEAWRAARKPVAQVLDTLPRDTWLKLLMDTNPFDQANRYAKIRSADEYRQAEIVRRKAGEEIAALFHDMKRAEQRLKWKTETLAADIAGIDAQKIKHQQMVEATRKREATLLTQVMQELAESLGLNPAEATAQSVTVAIRRFQKALTGGGLTEAIDLLQRLQGKLKEVAA